MLHIALSVVIVYISSKGSIKNATPRRNLNVFLYLKVFVFLIEMTWTVLGTVWSFFDTDCNFYVVLAARIMAIAGWVIMATLLVSLFVIFDSTGGSQRITTDATTLTRLWEMR